MRIALISDAWHPQRNGVVRVIDSVCRELARAGHKVHLLTPEIFRTVPLPSYPEIRIALMPGRGAARFLDAVAADAVHVATEGPLGWAARHWCLRRGMPFTTTYHTQFPYYLRTRTGLPLGVGFGLLRRFHAPSAGVLVPTPMVHAELSARGFANLRLWSHGVDCETFRPGPKDAFDLPRPIFLYVGRVAVDKNLPAFLDLDLPGSKLVVGDGPARPELMRRYPLARFHIANGDVELARCYSAADAFVFPSRTDTFGLVMLEALACGVPVAAFPVAGPRDVIAASGAGVLDEDLRAAALSALEIDPTACRRHAETFSWSAVTRSFVAALRPHPNQTT